jgi:histidinol dehydrogenase
MSVVRYVGALATLSTEGRAALLDRSFSADPELAPRVRAIVHEVRESGDTALRRLAKAHDGVDLAALEVPRAMLTNALARLDPAVRRGLERSARNLEKVAHAMLPRPSSVEVEPGVIVGRRPDPLARVGVYAPGGKAAYPSSVLMGVVPARAAGVGEVFVCSPPGPSGAPSDVVLAAAALASADHVFALGGAGAIAALAYGTASVPRVDRIVGPGNAWVAEAKRQVAGEVGIDAPAGPSEILIVADETAEPAALARELLAQAEHDEDACVVALVLGEALAARVVDAIEAALIGQPRRATIEAALRARGAVLSLDALDEAWPFVEAFAAEHLLLAVRDRAAALAEVRHAGTVFLGSTSSVAFGDYLTGANHVLPTAGAARRFSGLSVLDFMRWTTWQEVDPAAAARLSDDAAALAESEGLFAHADAARAWQGAAHSTPQRPAWAPRPTLAPIQRYVPTRPPCRIDLTDNTNLFGAPPGVLSLLASAPVEAVTRYPSPYADALREALAREVGVSVDEIVTGAGSDDVLDAAARAFGSPGDVLAYCPPTFSIVASFAYANGLVPTPCALSVDALITSGARVVYLCAPNNPTGAVLAPGFVDELLGRTRAVVLLDEAYIDFAAQPSRAQDAARSERLVVVRTMSKAFGLAGLRVGWAVGPRPLIAELEKTRGPYKVGGLAERAAIAALTLDRAWVQARVDEVRTLRERFIADLRARGFEPLPSQANFVLVPTPNAEAVAARMRAHGVSVRAFPSLPGLGDAVRISIGPAPMLDECLRALMEATR